VGSLRIPQKCVRIPYAELVFLCLVVSVGHVVHSDASGVQNVHSVFFMLRWNWCCFHKKWIETSYVKLVFLNPVGYASHVVHSGASGAWNVEALFFMLVWDLSIPQKAHQDTFHKNIVHSRAFGVQIIKTLIFMLRGPVQISEKVHRDKLRRTSVFGSGGICVSGSALQCVRGTKL
jgi:hypothetical protein